MSEPAGALGAVARPRAGARGPALLAGPPRHSATPRRPSPFIFRDTGRTWRDMARRLWSTLAARTCPALICRWPPPPTP